MNGPRAGAATPGGNDDALAGELAAIEGGRLDVGPGDTARLIRHLCHSRKALRRLAAGALGAAVRRGAIPPEVCERLLGSDDGQQRWGAAFALSRAGRNSAAVVEVATTTLDSGDGDLRWAAASIVIGAARESAALRVRLRELTESASATMRKMALLCLAESGEREAAIYLRALDDPETLVRIAALTALSRAGIATDGVLEAIGQLAGADRAAAVRRVAAAIHRRLSTPSG